MAPDSNCHPITAEEIVLAVARMRASIPMFPTDRLVDADLAALLDLIVENNWQLDWLTTTCVQSLRKWPGLVEIRAIYCTRYTPRDGKIEQSDVAGFRGEDLENEYFGREREANDQRLLAYREQRLLAGQPDAAAEFSGLVNNTKFGVGRRRIHYGESVPAKIHYAEPAAEVRLSPEAPEFGLADKAPLRTREETERMVRELEQKLRRRGPTALDGAEDRSRSFFPPGPDLKRSSS